MFIKFPSSRSISALLVIGLIIINIGICAEYKRDKFVYIFNDDNIEEAMEEFDNLFILFTHEYVFFPNFFLLNI